MLRAHVRGYAVGVRGGSWLGLVVAPLFVLGCAGPSEVSDLQEERYFYALDRAGSVTELDGIVKEVRSPRLAEVADEHSGDTTVSVVTAEPSSVREGDAVHVHGTLGQWHFSKPADKAPYIQHELYAKRTTRTYLYDAVLSPR